MGGHDYPVAYLTDVEGIWEKLASFCRDNPLVHLEGAHLRVRAGATFVFGGDAVDRGPHGLRVLRTLLEARARQPGQVVLLAGNRDINKLRLARELAGHPPASTPAEVRAGPRPRLLRWVLEHTMGARGAFEFRHEELARAGPRPGEEAVLESFLQDIGPGGLLRDYLQAAQLAHRIANTLFVHGGVHEGCLLRVPGRAPLPDVDAWVEALNAWYHEQLAAFCTGRLAPDGTPAWEPLVAYQAPAPGGRVNTGSVVYGRMADALNHPQLPSRAVVAALRGAGVRRLVVGHTPSGDCPSLLHAEGFELLLADNSYGRVRGASRVYLREERVRVEGEVQLDDGRPGRVAYERALDDEETPIGRQLADTGQLVKGPLSGGGWLLFRALPHYRIEQRALPDGALATRRLTPPGRAGVG